MPMIWSGSSSAPGTSKGPGASDPALQPRLPDGKGAPGNAWGNYRPLTTPDPVPGLPLTRPAGKARGPGLPVTEAVTATGRWAAENEAILHLVEICDPGVDRLVQAFAAVADVAQAIPPWAHLPPKYNPTLEWAGVLRDLGLDNENLRTLQLMAASGTAGQAEANRLVATWAKPASFNWKPYRNPPMVYQKCIDEATHRIAEGRNPWSYNAYFPSGAYGRPGPAWAAMDNYEPTWVRTNAACLWEQCVIKDAQGQPLGWKNPDPQRQPPFAPWKPSWGMRGAPGRE